jgi:hypothetical protein
LRTAFKSAIVAIRTSGLFGQVAPVMMEDGLAISGRELIAGFEEGQRRVVEVATRAATDKLARVLAGLLFAVLIGLVLWLWRIERRVTAIPTQFRILDLHVMLDESAKPSRHGDVYTFPVYTGNSAPASSEFIDRSWQPVCNSDGTPFECDEIIGVDMIFKRRYRDLNSFWQITTRIVKHPNGKSGIELVGQGFKIQEKWAGVDGLSRSVDFDLVVTAIRRE